MSARLEYTSEHQQFRDMVHDFVQQTVVPAHEEWEKAGCVDRSLFTEAGKLGLLAFSVPEEFGGFKAGHYTQMVWKDTTAIGAGKAIILEGEQKGWLVVVCNYDPPGNIAGVKPY